MRNTDKTAKSNEGYIGPATADVRKIQPGLSTGGAPGSPARAGDSQGLPAIDDSHDNLMDFNDDTKLKPNKCGSGFVH